MGSHAGNTDLGFLLHSDRRRFVGVEVLPVGAGAAIAPLERDGDIA
jgi:hypothetical protein